MIELLQTKEVIAALVLLFGTAITALATVGVAILKSKQERKAKSLEETRQAIEEYIEIAYQVFIAKNLSDDIKNRYQSNARRVVIGRVNHKTLDAIADLESGGTNQKFNRVIKLLRKEVGLKTNEVPHGTF